MVYHRTGKVCRLRLSGEDPMHCLSGRFLLPVTLTAVTAAVVTEIREMLESCTYAKTQSAEAHIVYV